MKRTARVLAMVLAMALVLLLAVGCTEKPGNSGTDGTTTTAKEIVVEKKVEDVIPAGKYDFGGATVTIASPYEVDLTPGVSLENDRLLSHIEAMKKNWNVNVEFKLIDADTYWGNMSTNILGGTAFGDICVGSQVYISDWIGAGAVRDIKAMAQEVGIDFQDGTWDTDCYNEAAWGNALYGFRRNASPMSFGVLYNKKTLAAHNLKDPNQLIAEGGEWTMKTFADYARAMTKLDADGETEVWGAAFTKRDVMLWGCIAGSGGTLVNYAEDGTATLALGDPKALAGMEIYNNMLNTDKSIAYIGYQNASTMLPSGEIGMLVCEEWIAEYTRDYALENGFENDWALTYFPKGDAMDHYVDPTEGSGTYFIPTCVDEEAAKRALICYAALYSYDSDTTLEQSTRERGEELFSDETSVDVYVNIITGERVSYMASRANLYYYFSDLAVQFEDNVGTPQSLLSGLSTSMETAIVDSAYTKVLNQQKGA